MKKLRVGRIAYANVFPIFYILERECDCSRYEFIDGVPATLNQMLRSGQIDVSPSSSIEYLRNPDLYSIVEGISVSSRGPVGSVFLFCRRAIKDLRDVVVGVTSQSATSVALLMILMRQFYGLRPYVQVLPDPVLYGGEAFLLIGDDALRERKRYDVEVSFRQAVPYVYDLGELWHRHTGLPFVFALWIARNDICRSGNERKDLFERFIRDLAYARKALLPRLGEVAEAAPLRSFLNREEIIAYWNLLDYDLDEEHLRGLQYFADLLP